MKKVFVFSLVCIMAMLATKGIKTQKNKLSSLYLKNLEALASDESNKPSRCYGSGSIDCPHSDKKVAAVYIGYSLE